MRAIVLLALCVAAVSAASIVNNYPHATPLLYSTNLVSFSQACGGAVLNQRSILTAAHCFLHPSYNRATFNNDVAVLRSASGISLNGNTVQAARIAPSNYNLGDNQPVWGITENGRSSEQLRHVQVWVVSQTVCRQRYGTARITNQMLCSGWINVGGRDQCQGDSGGPLYHNGVVVGVWSWGSGSWMRWIDQGRTTLSNYCV